MRARLNFRNGYEWRAIALLMLEDTNKARWSEEYREGYQAALVSLVNKFDAAKHTERDGARIKAVLDEWFV